jgi:hypothetical protein
MDTLSFYKYCNLNSMLHCFVLLSNKVLVYKVIMLLSCGCFIQYVLFVVFLYSVLQLKMFRQFILYYIVTL